MTGWVIGSIVALLLAVILSLLLAFLPVGVRALYDQEGFRACLSVGPVKVPLYPRPEKKKKKDKIEDKSKEKKSGKKKEKTGGSYTDFLPLARNALDLLKELRVRLVIRNLEFKLIMAGDDPCDLAVNYGKTWAAAGNLIALLEQMFTIKNRNISVNCDFTADKTTVYFRVYGYLRFYRLAIIAVVHGFSFLKKYLSIKNQRKGGANV